MKCFVTGGTGFIGSYVIKSLVERNHEAVVLCHRATGSRWLDELITEEEKSRITYVKGDINDKEGIKRIIVENGCRYIAHLASMLNRSTRANPVGGVRTNTLSFQNLLEICREENLEKIVWASSSAVYGIGQDRRNQYGEEDLEAVDEKTPLCPGSLYSYCKVFNEGLSNFYRNEYGIDSVGLRVNLSYGPYIQTSFTPFFSSLIDHPAVGQECRIPYSDMDFDFQYVGDMADTFTKALCSPRTKTGIFVTRGEVRPVKDAAMFLQKIFPDIKITLLGGDMDIPLKFNTALLEEEIGYIPEHTMEEGLIKSINMVRRSNGLEEIRL